jgi:hypothetical protein
MVVGDRRIEWVARCAHRLREHWRTVAVQSLEEIANDLWLNSELTHMQPEDAAIAWLSLGIPTCHSIFKTDGSSAANRGEKTLHRSRAR